MPSLSLHLSNLRGNSKLSLFRTQALHSSLHLSSQTQFYVSKWNAALVRPYPFLRVNTRDEARLEAAGSKRNVQMHETTGFSFLLDSSGIKIDRQGGCARPDMTAARANRR